MFTLGYLSLVQMFESVLGEEINSCLSYLTFINIWVLQRPVLAWAINYSWLGFASYSSPIYDCSVVINGNIPPGQLPKGMLLLSSYWLLLPSSCKSPRNRRNQTSTNIIYRCSCNFFLLCCSFWNFLSSPHPMQSSTVSSGAQLIPIRQHKNSCQ